MKAQTAGVPSSSGEKKPQREAVARAPIDPLDREDLHPAGAAGPQAPQQIPVTPFPNNRAGVQVCDYRDFLLALSGA